MLIKNPDMAWVFIDGTHVRAHQSSSGARKGSDQAIEESAGGNSSKIHLMTDAHGNPLDYIISDGVTHDVKIAPKLIESKGAHANIPRKKNNKQGNEHMDWEIYKARHVVKNTFARLKHSLKIHSWSFIMKFIFCFYQLFFYKKLSFY